eukprot:scaffold241513_cov23-Tisochrysis_lutea.AAC.2
MGWGLSPARSSQARPLAVAAQARYLAHQDGGRGELIDCMRVGLLGACSCSGMLNCCFAVTVVLFAIPSCAPPSSIEPVAVTLSSVVMLLQLVAVPSNVDCCAVIHQAGRCHVVICSHATPAGCHTVKCRSLCRHLPCWLPACCVVCRVAKHAHTGFTGFTNEAPSVKTHKC